MVYSVSLLVIVIPLAASARTTNVSVQATRIHGELYDLSILRCSLSPSSHRISQIDWIKGTKKDKNNYVYFDSTDPSVKNATGKRGVFKSNNVSGTFLNEESAHELTIYRSSGSEEDVYTCDVWTKTEEQYLSSHVNLTLNVRPKTPPSIQALDGRTLSTSDCDKRNIKVIRWTAKISLYCTVGASKPPPTVRWQISADGVKQHDVEFKSESYEDGLQLFSVKRRVDKTLEHDEKLRCRVNISNVGNDSFEFVDLCVWVHLYDPPKAHKFSWVMNAAVSYILVFFLGVWLLYRVCFVETGQSGRIINHSTWYLIALVFVSNTVTILHIQNDLEFHTQLLEKYQNVPDDPYLLYPKGLAWFGLSFFGIRLGFSIISFIVWFNLRDQVEEHDQLCGRSNGEDRQNVGEDGHNQSRAPLNTGVNEGNEQSDEKTKHNLQLFIRILLGPGVMLLFLMCERKAYRKKGQQESKLFRKRVWATKFCVVHRLVFQTAYLINGALMYSYSIPVLLTDDTSLQSPRIPTIIFFVVLALDIIVNALIMVVVQIKKEQGIKNKKKKEQCKIK